METALWWLRGAFAASLFIAALSVMDSIAGLNLYYEYTTGTIQAESYPELHSVFEKMEKSPFSFLGLNLYNIVLWSGVIVCSVRLLLFQRWAYKTLWILLSLDIFFTVLLLLYEAWQGTLTIGSKGWFLFINTLQIGTIILLAHPRINDLIAYYEKKENNPFKS